MVDSFTVSASSNGVPLLRQNENGPCFVISLINCLFLKTGDLPCRDKIEAFKNSLIIDDTGKTVKDVTVDSVYSFLSECLLNDELDGATVEDILNTLPLLDSGLLINPSFDDNVVTDFGLHSNTINCILKYFGIKVYHAFIMPEDLISMLYANKIKPNFDACQDYLVSSVYRPTEISYKIESFLKLHPTEITPEGCALLTLSMQEEEIAIFFRNDHYNTCTMHDLSIYLLVTDIGYTNQQDIMWTHLSVDDTGDFYNHMFEISEIKQNREKSNAEKLQESNDLIIAKQLQNKEDEAVAKSLQKMESEQRKPHNASSLKPTNTQPKMTSKKKAHDPSHTSCCIIM